MKLQTTIVYTHLEKCTKPIIVEQGGSRSSKSYNILIWLIVNAKTKWSNKVIDIVRKSFPSLRTSIMVDFFKILNDYNWYDEENHNKTSNEYTIGTNKFRFISCDEAQKVRGAGRDYLFLNEANELTLEEFRQFNMRTRTLTILDFNPSDEFHWIYDQVLTRPDVDFYQTTYRDNPFLDKRIVAEIEMYKTIDENYWRIYGLGERGVGEATIYKNWEIVRIPEPQGQTFYGLDFGFNHPTSLIKVIIADGFLYSRELLYETGLTTADIIQRLGELGLSGTDTIIGDSARPEAIEEIYRAGYNIHSCIKGKDSVITGIDYLKRQKIKVDAESVNLQKEFKQYKWKIDKEGRRLDEPVKVHDDAMDALRYAINEMLQGDDFIGLGSMRDY